jgi:SAM-dependent methyltransferase
MDAYYADDYAAVQRRGLQGRGNAIVDLAVERRVRRRAGQRILEIGASSGEHLEFVSRQPPWSCYVGLDLMPGVTDPDHLIRARSSAGVGFVAGDAGRMPFPDEVFDVVVSTCVLAHVAAPETCLEELRRVTRPGGQVVIAMPCDPGALNRLVKTVVTYPAMRRQGIEDPRLHYARGHVNPIGGLIALARHVFREDQVRLTYTPFRIRSWNANLVATLDVTIRSE